MSPLLEELCVKRGRNKVGESFRPQEANGKEPVGQLDVSLLRAGIKLSPPFPDEIITNE